MKFLFKHTHIDTINCFLLVLYCAVILVVASVQHSEKVIHTGTVHRVAEAEKYNSITTTITTTDGEIASFRFQKSFFDENSFLDIEENDDVSYYRNSSNKITAITNNTKHRALGIAYFAMRSLTLFQYVILAILVFYNGIQLLDLSARTKIRMRASGNERQTRLQSINNLTKKHFLVTALILGIVLYGVGNVLEIIKNNQSYLQGFDLYKYLVLFFPLLIPVPLMIKNHFLSKKIHDSSYLDGRM